jgi:hypothetical protein
MRSPLVSTVVERFLERKRHALRPNTMRCYKAHLLEVIRCCRNVAVNQVASEHIWRFVSEPSPPRCQRHRCQQVQTQPRRG